MSISVLRIINFWTKININIILDRLEKESYNKNCTEDDLAECVQAYILKNTNHKNMMDCFNDAIYYCTDLFDKGYNVEMILNSLYTNSEKGLYNKNNII
jgi:lipid A disaccharide synthetase